MQHNLNLQLSSSNMHAPEKPTNNEATREWIAALNTSFVTSFKTSSAQEQTELDLASVMQSPEFASLIVAAQHLAINQGLSKEEATDRLVRTFKNMNQIWTNLVIDRGLKSLI